MFLLFCFNAYAEVREGRCCMLISTGHGKTQRDRPKWDITWNKSASEARIGLPGRTSTSRSDLNLVVDFQLPERQPPTFRMCLISHCRILLPLGINQARYSSLPCRSVRWEIADADTDAGVAGCLGRVGDERSHSAGPAMAMREYREGGVARALRCSKCR